MDAAAEAFFQAHVVSWLLVQHQHVGPVAITRKHGAAQELFLGALCPKQGQSRLSGKLRLLAVIEPFVSCFTPSSLAAFSHIACLFR